MAALVFSGAASGGDRSAGAPVPVPVPRPEPVVATSLGGPVPAWLVNGHATTGWARYVETVPLRRFLDGIGCWGVEPAGPEGCEAFFARCARIGIRRVRLEVPWSSGLPEPDGGAGRFRFEPGRERWLEAVGRAAARHRVRPVFLLNANHGLPCPARATGVRFVRPARRGDLELLLEVEAPGILRPGYSGLSHLTGYQAAELLFTGIRPGPGPGQVRVRLARPLPVDAPAGRRHQVHTLDHRPFGDPDTHAETLAGWTAYVTGVARRVQASGLADGAVDFEVWNELGFGSRFLDIGHYDPSIQSRSRNEDLLAAAARAIREAFPERTHVINGFTNTEFYREGQFRRKPPPGISAESYHPYGFRVFPWPETAGRLISPLDPRYNVDGFVPRYRTFFPEQHGSFLFGMSLGALMQPPMRARFAARDDLVLARFMTESGLSLEALPAADRAGLEDRQAPDRLRSRFLSRLFPFYLNKGLHGVLDATLGELHPENPLVDFLVGGDPSRMAAWRPLELLSRTLEPFAVEIPEFLTSPIRFRAWQLDGVERFVFRGEESRIVRHGVRPPDLHFRDVLCLLPFQADPSTFAVAVYIQTRDLLEPHPDCGRFRIEMAGFPGTATLKVHLVDPENESRIPGSPTPRTDPGTGAGPGEEPGMEPGMKPGTDPGALAGAAPSRRFLEVEGGRDQTLSVSLDLADRPLWIVVNAGEERDRMFVDSWNQARREAVLPRIGP